MVEGVTGGAERSSGPGSEQAKEDVAVSRVGERRERRSARRWRQDALTRSRACEIARSSTRLAGASLGGQEANLLVHISSFLLNHHSRTRATRLTPGCCFRPGMPCSSAAEAAERLLPSYVPATDEDANTDSASPIPPDTFARRADSRRQVLSRHRPWSRAIGALFLLMSLLALRRSLSSSSYSARSAEAA